MATRKRRPSVLDDIAPAEEPANVAPGQPTQPPEVSQGRQQKREGIVHTSIYVPERAYDLLRQIAFARGRKAKVHDLIMEGVEAVLQRHGHPPLAELRDTKKL